MIVCWEDKYRKCRKICMKNIKYFSKNINMQGRGILMVVHRLVFMFVMGQNLSRCELFLLGWDWQQRPVIPRQIPFRTTDHQTVKKKNQLKSRLTSVPQHPKDSKCTHLKRLATLYKTREENSRVNMNRERERGRREQGTFLRHRLQRSEPAFRRRIVRWRRCWGRWGGAVLSPTGRGRWHSAPWCERCRGWAARLGNTTAPPSSLWPHLPHKRLLSSAEMQVNVSDDSLVPAFTYLLCYLLAPSCIELCMFCVRLRACTGESIQDILYLFAHVCNNAYTRAFTN